MHGLALAMLLVFGALASQADAQSPPDPQRKGSLFAPPPHDEKAQPLYSQADNLIYESGKNRVILRGSVELYFNNYILTADEVVYDQATNKLMAQGSAQLKDPHGSITRADRLELPGAFVDAFAASLSVKDTEQRFAVPPPK